MMIRIFTFLIVLGFVIGAPTLVSAENIDSPVFFHSIPDVPIMPGLRELPDQTVMFDKAQGRIVESVAIIESQFNEEVRVYYEDALPQLGWKRIDSGHYERAEERLQIGFEQIEDERFMRIRVAPKL